MTGVSRYFEYSHYFDLDAIAAQNEWFVDPAAGSDDAGGTTSAPLRTLTEWVKRQSLVPITTAKTVSIRGDLAAGDEPSGTIRVGSTGSLLVDGSPGVTSLHPGTFTTVTTCAPATNVPWSAIDSAIAANDWASYIDTAYGAVAGKRVRSGTLIMWPALNLGSKTIRLSQPIALDPSMTAYGQSLGSIATSDAYVVELLPRLRSLKLAFSITPGGSFLEQVVFHSLAFAGMADACVSSDSPGFLAAYGCDFGASGFRGGYSYVNCRHAGTPINIGDGVLIVGGLSTQQWFPAAGSSIAFDLRHMVQCNSGSSGGGGLVNRQGGIVWVGSMQVFNPHASGSGIVQAVAPGLYLAPLLGSSEVFGANTVNGLLVANGGIVGINSVTGKTIAGSSAAVKCGGLTGTTWSASNQPVAQLVTTAGSGSFAAILIE